MTGSIGKEICSLSESLVVDSSIGKEIDSLFNMEGEYIHYLRGFVGSALMEVEHIHNLRV